jgi:hypothetical protein
VCPGTSTCSVGLKVEEPVLVLLRLYTLCALFDSVPMFVHATFVHGGEQARFMSVCMSGCLPVFLFANLSLSAIVCQYVRICV